jgi:hypothetical protein
MIELFPTTLDLLEETSGDISYRLANVFTYGPKPELTGEQWEEYGDALEQLHIQLQHLEQLFHCEYTFSTDMQETANDVVNYTALLLKHRGPLTELAGFLLSQVGQEDGFVSDNRGVYLQDALYNIIPNCAVIRRLIGRE